jgi:general secretion pathway protein J
MTLIEVMIALAIFSVISIFTISSTDMGLRIKSKITKQNDTYQTLRTILRYLDRDISLAFHAFSDTKTGEMSRTQAVAANPLLAAYIPASFFKGTKDRLFFTSSSHQRMYKDTGETDTCKISYYIEQNPDDPEINDLIKRESTFIDDKIEESGARYVLASGVESISFKYYSPKGITEDGTWADVWDSTQGERMNTFPLAVEVTVVLASPENKEKKLKVVEKIKLINPNNLGEQPQRVMGGASGS